MGSVFHGYMCILLYMKLMQFSSVAKIYSQLGEGEWGQSAIGISPFYSILNLGSVVGLHRSMVN